MLYHFKVHKEENRYWAECLELPGCVTQADALTNVFRMQAFYIAYHKSPTAVGQIELEHHRTWFEKVRDKMWSQ